MFMKYYFYKPTFYLNNFNLIFLSGLDIVIHCAGTGAIVPIRELSLEQFNAPFKVDLQAGFLLSKYALPHLEKTKGNLAFLTSVLSMIKILGNKTNLLLFDFHYGLTLLTQ